jgi:phosphate transport system substrate-binding protein
MKTQRYLVYASLFLLISSCEQKQEETATKGHLRVLVAESVAPVLEKEVNRFMSLYKAHGADVSYVVVQSENANFRFINDTARSIVTTIPLTADEKNQVKKTTDNLVEIVLAYDGVVAVVHNKNPRNELSLKHVRDILTGKISRWEQIGHKQSVSGKIRLILEDSSDVSTYLSRRLLDGKGINAAFRRTQSSNQTLQEVSKDPLSLGFVGLNWTDSAGGRLKILTLAADSADADTTFKPTPESIGNAYSPHPAHIYLNFYPLKRAIYVYSRTTPGDFATGFTSFLGSPAGQKIFLEEGLVPGTQTIVLKRPGQ